MRGSPGGIVLSTVQLSPAATHPLVWGTAHSEALLAGSVVRGAIPASTRVRAAAFARGLHGGVAP